MAKKKKLGQVLVEKNLVSDKQIDEILKAQQHSQKLVGELLIERQVLSELLLYQALAHQYHMVFVDIQGTKLNAKLIQEVPLEIAEEYTIIPLEVKNDTLVVAVGNPRTSLPVAELTVLTGTKNIQTCLALPDQIREVIHAHFS